MFNMGWALDWNVPAQGCTLSSPTGLSSLNLLGITLWNPLDLCFSLLGLWVWECGVSFSCVLMKKKTCCVLYAWDANVCVKILVIMWRPSIRFVELMRIFEFNSWINILNINGYFTQHSCWMSLKVFCELDIMLSDSCMNGINHLHCDNWFISKPVTIKRTVYNKVRQGTVRTTDYWYCKVNTGWYCWPCKRFVS